MAPLSLRARVGRWLLKAAGNLILIPSWSRRGFMRPTYQALAQGGYRGNGAVYACISTLAFSFPEPPLLVWDQTDAGRAPLYDHALTSLLRNPNPFMSGSELLQYTIVYQAIGGTAYWYKVRSSAKRIVQLWPVHAGQITPIAGEISLVDHYEFDNGAGGKEILPEEDVVRFPWLPDPLQPQQGLAPLVAVAREVDTDNEATSYLFALLKNDAMPRLALVVPAERQPLTPDQFDRLQGQWKEEHGGEQRGGVAVLEGGLDIKQLATNLKDLEFNVLRHVPEARMCAAFRVPPVVAGLSVGLEQMTYNNVEGMTLQFTERTLVPLWRSVGDKASQDLLPEFGEPGKKIVAFDTDKVVALAQKNDTKRAWALPALSAGAILVNEFRAVMGLPRDANGDVYLRSLVMNESPARIEGAGGKVKTAPTTSSGGMEHKRATPAEIRRVAGVIAAQRAIREKTARSMETALEKYFAGLADRVIERAKAGAGPSSRKQDLPDVGDLITGDDGDELADLLTGFFTELLKATWPILDRELDVEIAFDLADPAVARVLQTAGARVKEINDTTLENIRVLLEQGHDAGWSIDHIVRGDPDAGIPGLRDVVEESYKDRAQTIARTELGTAQNLGTAGRYEASGVTQVLIFDDGAGDEDAPCVEANGAIWTLEEFHANPIQHPNCVRAAGASFGEASARPRIYGANDMSTRELKAAVLALEDAAKALRTAQVQAVAPAPSPGIEIKADNMTIEQRPEIKNEITAPAPDMQPVADAIERAIERIGKAIGDTPAPIISVQPSTVEVTNVVEPTPITVENVIDIPVPKRIRGSKRIKRGRDGMATGVDEESEIEY